MTAAIQIIAVLFVLGGSVFMLVAALGVYRLPDLLTRMHAATKAGTLGAGMMLLAVALVYQDIGLTTRVFATIVFLLLTAPVSAHAIGRAGYFSGVKVSTLLDELRDRYDERTHSLDSDDAGTTEAR